VCRRWEVRASVVGTVTQPAPGSAGRLRVRDGQGHVLADVPAASLSEDAPLYDRPMAPPTVSARRASGDADAEVESLGPAGAARDLLALLADAAWVYRQYDHQLFLNTVVGPGGDAAVLRLAAPGLPPSRRGLALSTDSNARWCAVDPRLGTAMVVAESALNVACAGARPVALVNCLNFGDPEHPEVMWQLSESVDGMAEACTALGLPVIGGNVSLYNATAGVDIDPTPVVAVLGIIDELVRRPPGATFGPDTSVVLLGETHRSLGGSRWAVERRGRSLGPLPPLGLDEHGRLLEFVVALVSGNGLVIGVHDVSDGGLAVALAECAVRSSLGCHVTGISSYAELFSESPSRVLLCTARPDEVVATAQAASVPARVIGATGGRRIVIEGLMDLAVDEAVEAWRRALPDALGEPVAF
jgi:phosphoribosylformylglycinamidine synthase